jgi:hypothetical protein
MKRTTCTLTVLVSLAWGTQSPAAINEDFLFDDADNTSLSAALNSGNPGNNWVEDTDHDPNIQVLGGSLNIIKNNTDFVTEGLGMDDVSSGVLIMTAEFKNWAFLGTAPDANNVEEIRFGFMGTEDLVPPPSSTVLAEMKLARNFDTNMMEISGSALGTAGKSIDPVAVNNIQNDPFKMIMVVNQDTDKYEIFYKDGANPTVSIGTGNLEPTRDAIVVRMTINNFIGDETGEFANLDRFTVVPEPASCLLGLSCLLPLASWRRFL